MSVFERYSCTWEILKDSSVALNVVPYLSRRSLVRCLSDIFNSDATELIVIFSA